MAHKLKRQILTPPNYANIGAGPSVFLIGPIQGAPDWQSVATESVKKNHPGVHIFNPRSGMWNKDLPDEEKERLYKMQLDWEHVHISHTLRYGGVIITWIPPEEVTIEGRQYAQTTRFELGAIYAWSAAANAIGYVHGASPRVAIGIHPNFSGRKYAMYTFSRTGVSIHNTLEDTLMRASQLLNSQWSPVLDAKPARSITGW